MRDFREILVRHAARYPLMEPQDYGKLAYQSEFGPAHLTENPDRVLPYLRSEWAELEADSSPKSLEPVGNGLCRFPLAELAEEDLPLLARLLLRTAQEHSGTQEGLEERLALLSRLDVPGMNEWLEGYRAKGCPVVGHSPLYRTAYRPHYRLLRTQYAGYFPVFSALERLLAAGKPAMVAIDGRCGSGKTGLAALLKELYPCNVIHTDDFYLPLDRRAPDWQEGIAGNMDLERLREEVLLPLSAGKQAVYRPMVCGTWQFAPERALEPGALTIVEGSYTHHPSLAERYDLKIFLTCPGPVQAARLQIREGDYFPNFQRTWMPLEERYFRTCSVSEHSDLVLDTLFLDDFLDG